ncbi:MAG: Sugar kinase, ribokinase [Parcubacteria group bacterium GW2011_GWA2_47_10b]|nr:MAG: Sugar kinase, ribokinase [Parcubacteria group bacterium GW2011_GWA2_47_10b]
MNTDSIAVSEKITTGAAFVAVDSSSENIIYVSGGANDDLTSADTKRVEIERGDIVSATLETPVETTKQLFNEARKIGAKTILNAAPAILDAEVLFPLVDYLIVNETELSVFARTEIPKNEKEVVEAMKKLQKSVRNIIATLGSKGVVALIEEKVITLNGHKVKAVDTTAAGDCFVGAFVVALQNDKIIKQAMDLANVAAAISVQRPGASSSLPTKNEMENFLTKA